MTLRRADSAAVHHVPFLEDVQLLVIKVTHADVFKDLFFLLLRGSHPLHKVGVGFSLHNVALEGRKKCDCKSVTHGCHHPIFEGVAHSCQRPAEPGCDVWTE